jgi:Tfp pilus assembly protein PilO
MQQHRIISLLSVLIMVIIPVVGWFLIAQPQLAAASLADEQRADMESQIAESTATVAQLKADSAKLPELNDDLNDLRTSIPASVDSSGYIDGLDAQARTAGVTITDLTVGDPVAYVPAVDGSAPAADTVGNGSTDAAVDPAAETPADSVAGDLPPAVVTDPLITASSFVAIPVSVGVTGEWGPILNFVDGLQSSPRLFLVTTVSTAQIDETGTSLSGKVEGFIYAIPTGVEGKPRPVSTVVKSMAPPAPQVDTTEGDSTDEPDPDSTEPPAAP